MTPTEPQSSTTVTAGELVITRVFDAPRELVWKAWTNPEHLNTKYVASNSLTGHPWQKTVFLSGDVPGEIRKLKQQAGPELQVHGSAQLI
jgi:uncharacterized protein YndB with AHSA1/START domain